MSKFKCRHSYPSRREFLKTTAVGCAAYLTPSLTLPIVTGCDKTQKNETPPNIILITLDTVRADHLGCYGYGRPTSASLDTFAQSSTLYTKAYASAPWTVPTHASLFTGKFPCQHGAHSFFVSEKKNNAYPLHPNHVTIAEMLNARGYATAAFAANAAYLNKRWQLCQGFSTYYVKKVHADALNETVTSWMQNNKNAPFFLFINYMDSHRPYNTSIPAPFLKSPITENTSILLNKLYEAVMPGGNPPPQGLVQEVIDAYDNSIWILDRQLNQLFNTLKSMGIYDNSLIIITSDHGEFFGEHDLVEHSKDIYQEVLWVPLIVKNPRQKKSKMIQDMVTSPDIPDLIANQLPSDMQKQFKEVFPLKIGNHDVIAENYYTRPKDLLNPVWGHRFNRTRTAIYQWPYKYIDSSDGKNELYHLEHDKREANNLVAEIPNVANTLAQEISRFKSMNKNVFPQGEQLPFSEEEIRRLKSLGYL